MLRRDRLFNDFDAGWRSPVRPARSNVEPTRGDITSGVMPVVDVTDMANAYEVSAELPGLDEKNIQVSFSNGWPD
jgi:HSP20 family protein